MIRPTTLCTRGSWRPLTGALFFIAIGAVAGLLPALTGCATDPTEGYVFESTYDQHKRTIAVPVFENTTYSHGVEMRLTEAIMKEIDRTTPWTVTAGAADTTLSGAITDVSLRKLNTRRHSGLVQEMAVDIAVDFQWRDNKAGKTLVERRRFRGSSTFVPAYGVGERMEIGEQGAIEALARDIVAELRSDW